ncbi:response regulator [Duganella sp. FT80W]|uniref:Response regulator n=1 Tax=Duganella guangzhouensis TaxID=2666084 RepID=A0A6I2L403_9BURK|nr:response regulator [Duganella guangzhouensis]
MRCLVIEDEAETSNYICKGLREAGYQVTAAANGPDGLDHASNEDWDIIILDRMLPGRIDGLSIVDKLRALGKQTPVIIVSALSTIDARVTGLRGGADDYLPKPFAFSELLARVEALLRRSAPGADSTQLQVADLRLDLRTLRVTRGVKVITLQPREYRLLEYLMRNENQVVTRTMLLESVWDYHFDPQTNVIDVQISRLRAKVDKDFPLQLIHTLRGVGYRMGVTPPEQAEPPLV